MSRNGNDKKQMAPSNVPFLQRRRCVRAGRRDAREFDSAHPETITPRIAEFQGVAKVRQHGVLEWFARESTPYLVGIKQSQAQIVELEEDLREAKAQRPSAPRAIAQQAAKVQLIESQIAARKAQIEFNKANGRRLQDQARHYLDSWASFAAQMSALYAIGRAQKAKTLQPGTSYKAPVFAGLTLESSPEFD